MFCFPDTGRARGRIRVSALREVTRQSEAAGTEALLGLAEQHPVPDSPRFKKFWKAAGFFSAPGLAHPPNSLRIREIEVQSIV